MAVTCAQIQKKKKSQKATTNGSCHEKQAKYVYNLMLVSRKAHCKTFYLEEWYKLLIQSINYIQLGMLIYLSYMCQRSSEKKRIYYFVLFPNTQVSLISCFKFFS